MEANPPSGKLCVPPPKIDPVLGGHSREDRNLCLRAPLRFRSFVVLLSHKFKDTGPKCLLTRSSGSRHLGAQTTAVCDWWIVQTGAAEADQSEGRADWP